MAATLTIATLASSIAGLSDDDHALLRIALKSRRVPAQAGDVTAGAEFASKEARAAGKGHACTAVPPCTRTDLRTAARAAAHGVDTGGHTAR